MPPGSAELSSSCPFNPPPRLDRLIRPSARSAQLPYDAVERRRHCLLSADLVPALATLPKRVERPSLGAVPPEAAQSEANRRAVGWHLLAGRHRGAQDLHR